MTRFNDHLEIVGLLNQGTYFDAYEAIETTLGRRVFLKVARAGDELAARVVAAHVEQWKQIARAQIAELPIVYSVGRVDDLPFLVTEWVEGKTLRQAVEDKAVPGGIESALLGGLVALKELHRRGLVHGDINPGNILIGEHPEAVRLVDPAPSLDGIANQQGEGRLVLTNPAFTAPEVLNGAPMTPAADLFALGAVMAEASRRLGVDLSPLVTRLIAQDPGKRPESARQAWMILIGADRSMAVSGVESPPSPPPMSSPDGWDRVSIILSVPVLPPPPAPAPPDGWNDVSILRSVPVPRPVPVLQPGDWHARSMAVSVPVPSSHAPVVVPQVDRASSAMPADFAVVAPTAIEPGRHFVVEVWVGPSDGSDAMMREATRRGRMVERGGRSHIDLKRDTLVTVVLQLPDFELAGAVETLGWQGDIRNVGFMVKAPSGLAPGLYPGQAKLMQGQVPFASIWFDLEIGQSGAAESTPLPSRIRRIARAFASYASQDRAEVLRRIQGIQAAGTDVFLDIVSLRSGEDWERTLYREIGTCDGFFLFWSRNASASPWVEKEWRYALAERGLAFINPLALEDPRLVKPPPELSSKHFNDMLLAFISNEEFLRRGA
jgi:serine/threonine protein kinase